MGDGEDRLDRVSAPGCVSRAPGPGPGEIFLPRRVSCHGPVEVGRAGGTDANLVFACSGTPVDCIRIGLMAQPFPEFDVVVSGLNHGVNVGDVATYSGTLGAALEAGMLGVPALALSQ